LEIILHGAYVFILSTISTNGFGSRSNRNFDIGIALFFFKQILEQAR